MKSIDHILMNLYTNSSNPGYPTPNDLITTTTQYFNFFNNARQIHTKYIDHTGNPVKHDPITEAYNYLTYFIQTYSFDYDTDYKIILHEFIQPLKQLLNNNEHNNDIEKQSFVLNTLPTHIQMFWDTSEKDQQKLRIKLSIKDTLESF